MRRSPSRAATRSHVARPSGPETYPLVELDARQERLSRNGLPAGPNAPLGLARRGDPTCRRGRPRRPPRCVPGVHAVRGRRPIPPPDRARRPGGTGARPHRRDPRRDRPAGDRLAERPRARELGLVSDRSAPDPDRAPGVVLTGRAHRPSGCVRPRPGGRLLLGGRPADSGALRVPAIGTVLVVLCAGLAVTDAARGYGDTFRAVTHSLAVLGIISAWLLEAQTHRRAHDLPLAA